MLLMEHEWLRQKNPLNFMNYFKAYLKTTFRRRWSVEFVIKNLLNLQSLERLKIL